MKARGLLKGAGLVAASAVLIVAVILAGILSFVYYNTAAGRVWGVPLRLLSAALDPKAHQSLRPRSGGLYKGIQPLSLQLQYTPLFSPQQQRIVHVQPSDS